MNVQPQTRTTRKSQLFREDLEKMRLRERREGFTHYEVRARRRRASNSASGHAQEITRADAVRCSARAGGRIDAAGGLAGVHQRG